MILTDTQIVVTIQFILIVSSILFYPKVPHRYGRAPLDIKFN